MWFVFALLSAVFAALTSILAKVGIEEVSSNLATAIRTVVVLIMAWGMVFLTNTQGVISDISKKELDIPDTVRTRDRRVVALLLPRASDRRGVEGRAGRQAERRHNSRYGVRFPAREIHGKVAPRLRADRRGHARHGALKKKTV